MTTNDSTILLDGPQVCKLAQGIRLKLKRDRRTGRGKEWSRKDDEKLKLYHSKGMSLEEMAGRLGRGLSSISNRIREKGLSDLPERSRKRKFEWEIINLIPSHELASRGGLRG